MGVFDDIDDAVAELDVDADVMGGEALSFTPKGGSARTIYGVVDRLPRQPMRVNGALTACRFRIVVRNHATAGIDPSASDTLRGTLAVPLRKGGSTVTLTIDRDNLESQSAGALTLAWE